MIPIATTTSPAKTSRQLRFVVIHPPRIGPTAIPAPATPPRTPNAAARARPSKFVATSATIAGITSAAPIPSRTDHPSASEPTVHDTAVSAEPVA